jgi:hypothetical protein
MVMPDFDLNNCLRCKDETFISYFKRIPSFTEVEKALAQIIHTEKALVFSDIRRLTSKRLWVFEDFWTMPPKKVLKANLKRTKGLFKALPQQEEQVIGILYDIFKNIEVVSVVLRFIDPVDYGIMSPPVKYVTRQSPGKNHVDEYLDYLCVLRQYRDTYDFTRIADVDIALWILCHKCIFTGGSQCENYSQFQKLLVSMDEEIITKNHLFLELQNELLNILAEEETHRTEQLIRSSSEKEKAITEYERKIKEFKERIEMLEGQISQLKEQRIIYPHSLIRLPDSNLNSEDKLIHDNREDYIDYGQSHFMKKLAGINIVNKIVWSENISSHSKTCISNISSDGEITILYVNKDHYAAKIKAFPVNCPDSTHAKHFANTIAEVMNIPLAKNKLLDNLSKTLRLKPQKTQVKTGIVKGNNKS